MKKLINLILILFVSLQLHGQIENRIIKKVIECNEISFNCSELFADFISQNQYDSAKLVLDLWEKHCGMREPIMRSKILLGLVESNLKEAIYDTNIFIYVQNYISRVDCSKRADYHQSYEYYSTYFSYIPPNSKFDITTKQFSNNLNLRENSLENLFIMLYREKIDSFYYFLKLPEFKNLLLRRLYDKEVAKINKLWEGHFDITAGSYLPTGNAKLLGNHANIGISGGFKANKITYDFSFQFRFVNSPEYYNVKRADTTFITNHFFSTYIGLDLSYPLFKVFKNEFLIMTGIGYESLETEKSVSAKAGEIISIDKANFNFGLMQRWYFNDRNYVGLSYKYNIINYNSRKIVENLSGNFHSVGLHFGWLDNKTKRERLTELRQKYN